MKSCNSFMDKKAKDILFKTYWSSSSGWIATPNTDPESFAYAKEKGLMFDPITITKSELLTKLEEVLASSSLKKAIDAFLCSLTNKRLDWRSGFASYINAHRLLRHPNVSDFYFGHGTDLDLSILNFERIKWSGVRHSNGLYNWLDVSLSLLAKEIIPNPTQQDIDLFQSILRVIDESDADESPSKLRERLKEVFKASKNERHVLLEIFGCAGILRSSRYDRKEPGKHDWTFVLHWRGEDSYNKQLVKHYFGHYGIE